MVARSPDRLMIVDNPESRPREAFNMEVDYEFTNKEARKTSQDKAS